MEAGQRIHPECIEAFSQEKDAKSLREHAKRVQMAARVDKALTKQKLADIKPRSKWLAECKVAIQKVRRLEELSKGRGCISCKRTREEVEAGEWRPGGYWDGGHFKSKGAHPEMSLEPLNIWLQCKSCNAGSGKYARKGYTVNASFEANLIELEGAELVDWLNGPHELKNYSKDDLMALKREYAAKARALEVGQ
jgi:hypothetical protein